MGKYDWRLGNLKGVYLFHLIKETLRKGECGGNKAKWKREYLAVMQEKGRDGNVGTAARINKDDVCGKPYNETCFM